MWMRTVCVKACFHLDEDEATTTTYVCANCQIV